MKEITEKINKNKEETKLNIQKTFTKLRNELNNREDQLLLEVDDKTSKEYINEDIIKQSEMIPKKIKIYLDKGKEIKDEEWNENKKLKFLINDCINIENNIKIIDEINKNIEKFNNINLNIKFTPLSNELNDYLNKIKIFGDLLVEDKFIFKFRQGPNYSLNDNGLIATKENGNDFNCTIIGEKPIPKNIKSSWKIRLNKFGNTSYDWTIIIGIGPNNENNEKNFYNKCWSFVCDTSCLIKKGENIKYFNYSGKLKNGDIVGVFVDRQEGTLSFSVNNKNYGIAFSEIPKEEELYPIVIIFPQGNIVEIV